MSILPEGNYDVGDDVTSVLGITKYEAPIPASLSGEVKGAFPGFIPKTDEPRVQTIQDLLDKYQGHEFYAAEKLDGTSVTYYIKDGQFGVCSRNLEMKETEDNTIWKLAKYYDIENKLKKTKLNLAIQGELIGEGVQKNIYKLRGQKFYLFNVFAIDSNRYLPLTTIENLLSIMNEKAAVKLELVPIVGVINLSNNIDEIVKQAMGKSVLNNEAEREGLVFRLLDQEIWDAEFGRVSFKAINPEYLLKYGE
jgi:RNA ligase (TIGR02306 family)